MPAIDPIKAYLAAVCDQIRWKKCHSSIASELEGHLLDQRDALVQEGANEAEATTQAIAMMGDPVTVGTQLDRTHRPKPQWSMLILTVLLVLAGTAIQFIVLQDPDYGGSRFMSEWRSSLTTLACLPVLAVAYFADFTLLARYPRFLMVGTVFMVVVALIFSKDNPSAFVNGYPHYFLYMPMLFPVLFAGFLYYIRGRGYSAVAGGLTVILLAAAIATKISSSFGVLLIMACGLMMLVFTISKNWFAVKKLYALTGAGIVLAAASLAWLYSEIQRSSHILERLKVLLHPGYDSSGNGYHSLFTKSLLQHAVLWGKGTVPEQYQGRPSLYIAAHTDNLFTYVIFKMGWIAFAIVLALILLFLIQGFLLSLRQRNALGQLVALSVMSVFTIEFLLYLAFNLGYILALPFSMPLLSYGRVPLIFHLALTGLLLSVFRTGHAVGDSGRLAAPTSGQRFLTWENRRLIIDFSKRK